MSSNGSSLRLRSGRRVVSRRSAEESNDERKVRPRSEELNENVENDNQNMEVKNEMKMIR